MKSFYNKDEYAKYTAHQTKKWQVKATKKRAYREYESIFKKLIEVDDVKTILESDRSSVDKSLAVHEMICLGARNDHEKNSFKNLFLTKEIDVNVFSLDIARKASVDYHYDFGDMPYTWKDRFSIVYTNAPDHAFDFSLCLSEWKRILAPGGICIIGVSDINIETTNSSDNNLSEEDCTLFDSKAEVDKIMNDTFSNVTFVSRHDVDGTKMNYNYWICTK